MKNLIYDVIVGGILLVSLIGIVPIMKANQNYIARSALTKTGTERLELDTSSTSYVGNAYNIMDVYAFLLQNLNEDGILPTEVAITIEKSVTGEASDIELTYLKDTTIVNNALEKIKDKFSDTTSTYNIEKELSSVRVSGVDVVVTKYIISKITI